MNLSNPIHCVVVIVSGVILAFVISPWFFLMALIGLVAYLLSVVKFLFS